MADFAYTARSLTGQATTGIVSAESMDQALQSVQAAYGKKVAPLQLPIGAQDKFAGAAPGR